MREIKLLVHDLWTYYGQAVDPEQLGMMAEDLADHEPATISRAMAQWRKTPPERGHKPRAPMPCELIGLMAPKSTVEEEADLIAGNILACVKTWGRPNRAQAEQRLGYQAWQVVVARGGWDSLCSIIESDLHVHHAQLRDIAKATLRRDPMGLSAQERQLAAKDQEALPERGQDVVAKLAQAMAMS